MNKSSDGEDDRDGDRSSRPKPPRLHAESPREDQGANRPVSTSSPTTLSVVSTAYPRSGAGKDAKSLSLDQAEQSVDYLDRDITDRDVLKGLKMAICAACDEDLDAWIRIKTGLRLRRFLADLRAFEDLEQERTKNMGDGRRISRRKPAENRRLEAEKERRRRNIAAAAEKENNDKQNIADQ